MASERGPLVNLAIARGKTFTRTLQAGARPFIYAAIAAISKAAPAQIECQAAHGLPDGWPVAVVSVQGMRQINANDPPRATDYHAATVIDTTTITLNDVNSAGYSTHTADTGYLQFYTPADLSGATARMTIKDKEGGTALIELDSDGNGIVVDNTTKTITITIAASVTAAITWLRGTYDAELELASGIVVPLMYGAVTIEGEITT